MLGVTGIVVSRRGQFARKMLCNGRGQRRRIRSDHNQCVAGFDPFVYAGPIFGREFLPNGYQEPLPAVSRQLPVDGNSAATREWGRGEHASHIPADRPSRERRIRHHCNCLRQRTTDRTDFARPAGVPTSAVTTTSTTNAISSTLREPAKRLMRNPWQPGNDPGKARSLLAPASRPDPGPRTSNVQTAPRPRRRPWPTPASGAGLVDTRDLSGTNHISIDHDLAARPTATTARDELPSGGPPASVRMPALLQQLVSLRQHVDGSLSAGPGRTTGRRRIDITTRQPQTTPGQRRSSIETAPLLTNLPCRSASHQTANRNIRSRNSQSI